MQHKIIATIVLSALALFGVKAQVAVNETTFSSHILAALKSQWPAVAADGTLTADDIVLITELSLKGTGKSDVLSLKGIEKLTSVTTLELRDLKYDGDFAALEGTATNPMSVTQLSFYGCELGVLKIYKTIKEIDIYDKSTFSDIVLAGGDGSDLETILLSNLDITDYNPTLVKGQDFRHPGYLEIINCPNLVHANLKGGESLNVNGVPMLESIDWNQNGYNKLGRTSTNCVTLNKALGIVIAEPFYVYSRKGFKSVVSLNLPDKSTAIDFTKYDLLTSRVEGITGPASIDGNTMKIDWTQVTGDEAKITYRYVCLKGVTKKYLEVSLTVTVKAESGVKDTQAPVIKVGDTALGATASYDKSVTLTITDNVGVASVTINDKAATAPYTIPATDGTYKVVAKDAAGNSATTTITIKLPDTQKPVIKVGDTALGATASYDKSVTLTITDNVGVASVTINDKAATAPYTIPATEGTYKVVAKDAAGNAATTTITIKLPDTQKPVIKVGDTALGATASYDKSVTLTITDNVGVASVTINDKAATAPYTIPATDGTYKVVAKDAAGNTATTTITIKLPDTQKPVIKVGDTALGATASYDKSVTLTITDNVGVASVTINDKAATAPYTIPATDGTYKVVAKDAAGNAATTTITIKLPDTQKPVIKVGDTALGATASYDKSVTLTITDNVGVASVTINDKAATAPYTIPATDGTYKVVAKDAAGNAATTTITIKLPDTQKPVIKVGDTALGATASYDKSVTLTINDNVGVASVTINDKAATAPYTIPATDGTYKVVAKDAAGNTATTTITIKLPVVEPEDKEAPVIKVDGTVLGPTASYGKSVTLTITDNVGVSSVTINDKAATAPYTIPATDGTYKVVAKDKAGNTATTTITIKLPVVEPEDTDAPVIKVDGTALGATASYDKSVTLTITDNVGVASVTINDKAATAPYTIPATDGTYKVVAKDKAGNTATTTITIKLPVVEPEDKEAPVIKVDGTVLGPTASYDKSVTLTITDNVGVASVTINDKAATAPYTIPATDGTYKVVAKDKAGNTATTTITIKLPVVEPEDTDAPVIKVDGTVLGPTASYDKSVTLTITDNVGVASVTINDKAATAPYTIPATDGTYKVVAKDKAGNTATTTITIKLPVVEPADKEAPVIMVGDKKLGSVAQYEAGVTLNITDNVDKVLLVTINRVEATAPYTIPDVDGEYVVVAKDAAGNAATTTITVKHPVIIPDPEPEPGGATVIQPSDVQTTVFRKVVTESFKGIEVLAKEKVQIEIFDEKGDKVDLKVLRLESKASRVALPVGKYKVNIGQFKNVAIEIK